MYSLIEKKTVKKELQMLGMSLQLTCNVSAVLSFNTITKIRNR